MRQSVETLGQQSMLRVPGFFVTADTIPPPTENPSLTAPDGQAPKPTLKPIEGAEAERLALQMVSQSNAARHASAAVLAPFLGLGGGVRDAECAHGVIQLADAFAIEINPSFAAQLQILDALLATKDPSALHILSNSAHLAVALSSMISRAQKHKNYTLMVKSLRIMAMLPGSSTHLTWKSRHFLRKLAKDESNLAVTHACRDLIATWPPEEEDFASTPDTAPTLPTAAASGSAAIPTQAALSGAVPTEKISKPVPLRGSKSPGSPQNKTAAVVVDSSSLAVALADMKPEIPFQPPPIYAQAMRILTEEQSFVTGPLGVVAQGSTIPRADPLIQPTTIPFYPSDPEEFRLQNEVMIKAGVKSPAYVDLNMK